MSKRTNTTLITRAEFDARVNKIAELQLERKRLLVQRDGEKEAVLRHYNDLIHQLDLEAKLAQSEAQAYATANWESIAPPKSKSAESTLATFGFRTGQPTLRKLVKDKEADVAEQLYQDGHVDLVDAKFSLNKKAILRAIKEGLAILGDLFAVEQKERFYVEAKAIKED